MPEVLPLLRLPAINMKPSQGLAFIIEDMKDTKSASGILLAQKNERKAGTGVIYGVNEQVMCPYCVKTITQNLFKKGDHVIYSSAVAEFVDYKEEGMSTGRLFSVPTDAILAKIL